MPDSFHVTHGLADTPVKRRPVLVTGAAGTIGRYFAEHTADRYPLRLLDHGDIDPALKKFGDVVSGDITDADQMRDVCNGIDTVLHLAADPSPKADWDTLLPVNIRGTVNMVEAALAAGCRRLIFASSIHAISGYPADVQVKTNDPPNPGDLYGVTKCFGEALCRNAAEQRGLSTICVRIGAFQPAEKLDDPDSLKLMDAFVSQRDLTQLLCRCVDAEDVQFAIVHGLSESRFKRMDLTTTRELLGYAPQDNFTERNPAVADLDLDETVMRHAGTGA